MKTRTAVLLAVIGMVTISMLLFLLSGCSSGRSYDRDDGSQYLDIETINVDGRDVTCIVGRSGISCDW